RLCSSTSPCRDRALLSFPTRRSSDLRPLSVSVPLRNESGPLDVRASTVPCTSVKRKGPLDVRACSVPLCPLTVMEPLDVRSETRSEEHTSELQSRENLVCRLLLEKKK